MENLNAEKVKRGLQCCSNNDECVGEACPYYTTGCEKNMPKDALALINSQEQRIKELTEQAYRLECDLQLNADEKTVAKAIEQTKKATVRKMQERLDKHFCHDPAFLGVEQRLIMGVVYQIAKEMLEETK